MHWIGRELCRDVCLDVREPQSFVADIVNKRNTQVVIIKQLDREKLRAGCKSRRE